MDVGVKINTALDRLSGTSERCKLWWGPGLAAGSGARRFHLPAYFPISCTCLCSQVQDFRLFTAHVRGFPGIYHLWMWQNLAMPTMWQGSAGQVVDDETMAVEASRKRFWKAFDAELGLSCEDTELGVMLATLARRRGGRKGLTPLMVTNEVAALRDCASMHPYNTQFIVAAFNALAKPDWWVWDILEKCFPDEEDVTLWSADELCDKLGTRLTSTVGDKATLEAVVDRLHIWRQAESNSGAQKKESDYLVAYRNRNEAWNYYRLCTIRFETLGDYRAGLRNLSTVPLTVSRTRSNALRKSWIMYVVSMHLIIAYSFKAD